MKNLCVGRFASWGAWAGIALVCVSTSGCGSSADPEQLEESNLKPLAVFYGQFISQHQGRQPANEAEFKEFVRSLPSEQLAGFNVTDPESLFVSPRDGKPYVVVYAGPEDSSGVVGAPVIAYEQVGVRGKRYVANLMGQVEEVDEAGFKERVPNAR
jgi:hypothetical protein